MKYDLIYDHWVNECRSELERMRDEHVDNH